MTTENIPAQAGDEPIPCPFCGGAPQVDNEHDDRGNRVIECAGCGANVGANMLSAGWRRWNQRVSPRATAEVERDAARYQFLRHCDLDALAADNWGIKEVYTGKKLDDAIDAAIATAKPGA